MIETALILLKLIGERVAVALSSTAILGVLSKLRFKNVLKWISKNRPKLYIGVDMGRSQFNYVLIRYTPKKKEESFYEVLSTLKYHHDHSIIRPNSKVFEDIVDEIQRLISGEDNNLNIKSTKIDGIVFGVPGLVQPSTGVIEQAINFLGDNRKLEFIDEFVSACKKKEFVLNDKCLQQLDNDGNCLTRYVCWYHTKRMRQGAVKAGNFVCFMVGNNFGAGIAINNNLFYGDNHKAGEVGHMVIESGVEPCPCGKGSGHAEQRISRVGLEHLIAIYSDNNDSILTAPSGRLYSLVRERLIANVSTPDNNTDKADPVVSAVNHLTRYLATTIANMINVLDIHQFYFSGAMMRELFFHDDLELEASLREIVDEYTFVSIRKINFTLVDNFYEKSKGGNIFDDRYHSAIGAALACEDTSYLTTPDA